MAMEQGQSRLPRDKVYLRRLIWLQRDYIFLHSRRGVGADADNFKCVAMQV